MNRLTISNLKHIIKHYEETSCPIGINLRYQAEVEIARRVKILDTCK